MSALASSLSAPARRAAPAGRWAATSAAAVVVAAAVLTAPDARAEPARGSEGEAVEPAPTARPWMRLELDEYFAGERAEGSVFMGLGASSMFGGGVSYAQGAEWSRGASAPLLAFGVVHFAVGAVVWARSNDQAARLRAILRRNPARLRDLELARMDRVNRQFRWLALVEIGLAAAGAGLASYGVVADKPGWTGAGVALGVESLVTLGLDYFAARRAADYTRALETFDPALR